MRIVTDGKYFAIARRRWIFTQFWSFGAKQWTLKSDGIFDEFPDHYWYKSLDLAKQDLNEVKRITYRKIVDV